MPTADASASPSSSDRAGFAYLEVSGGGVFDTAVRRGVESPWERIRALKAKTKTPLGMALRGRFLVGSHPVGGDFARRFVASAAESGIDVFSPRGPAERRLEPPRGGRGDHRADREFDAGLIYSPGPGGEKQLVEQAKKLPSSGCARPPARPQGALEPHRANELVAVLAEGRASRRALLPGCGGRRAQPRRSRLRAPGRISSPARSIRSRSRCIVCPARRSPARSRAPEWELVSTSTPSAQAAEIVDEFIGDDPVTPLAPHIAVRAAQHELPAGLVAAIRHGFGRTEPATGSTTSSRSWP